MKKSILNSLLSLLSDYSLDGYIVPKNDSFFTEQVNHDRLKLVSNFSGSAGFAIIFHKKKPAWVFLENKLLSISSSDIRKTENYI